MRNFLRKTSKAALLLFAVVLFGCSEDEKVAVTAVNLSEEEIEVSVGQSKLVNAIVTPSDASDKSVTWSSADVSIATVNNGTITGVTAGIIDITAASVSNPNVKATVKVTVPDDIAGAAVGTYKGDVNLIMGGNSVGAFAVDAVAEFTAVDATTLHWNTSVATTPMGAAFATEFVVEDFVLTVAREGNRLIITGTGTANDGAITPVDVEGTIEAGNIVMDLTVGGAPGPLRFEGQKQ